MSEYITIKRAELEQVLEAIEDLRGYRKDIDEAITTLRESAQQAEPVAWIDALKDAFFEGFTSVATYNDTLLNSPEEAWENYKPPRTAPPQQAETVEPVAQVHPNHLKPTDDGKPWCREALLYSGDHNGDLFKSENYRVKLYTAPPQRKPLSEEEIGRLCDEVSWSPRQLARAVERAHGIKE